MIRPRGVRGILRRLPTYARSAILRLAGPAPPDRVRVGYGLGVPAADRREVHGGMVKLQRMQARFPTAVRCNVLYLVSSRLPAGVDAFRDLIEDGRLPLVWNQNGVAYPGWHGPGWERTNEPMAQMLRMASHVVYQSEFCKASADRFLGPSAAAWDILYNAVDTATFAPVSRPERRDELVILVGGTQDVRYRLATALDAFALVARRHPRARLLVTGGFRWGAGDATGEARRLVADSGVADRVTLLGPYTQAEAPSVYGQADLLLHCKVNDPSPGLVVEALACGLPVVYSATGGTPEIVGKDAGIGVPGVLDFDRDVPPAPSPVADAIFEAADRRAQLAEAARQRAVERFDLRPWLARHAEIFERVLARAAAAR